MSPERPTTPWFARAKPDTHARLRLFCFPYAGGGAVIYRGWENYVPAGVEVFPIQPPGRGSRFREPPFDRMEALVSAVATEIEPYLDRPVALFGHSVGALASFELAHRLSDQFGFNVSHLFVSGARAPHVPRKRRDLHDLPEDEFRTELKTLNGTPPEILENPELMSMISSTLRADFAVAETYRCNHTQLLSCPITVFGGLADTPISREDLEAWRIHTTGSFEVRQMPGDHFFIHSSSSLLLGILSRELARLISKH
ncbi:MAG TPA: alpha/beta fold hydrolase [Pyrinomonadaceae bacterium]|nr:alpha/beta fold hydrolase [Pyrinomonadaceae bacterium]